MDKKKLKTNLIVVVLIAFLIGFALMIRFEVNPFSFFIGNLDDEPKDEVLENSNGFYRYRENLGKTYTLFSGCTLSYIDNLIVIVNEKYYVYRTSCIGTFKKSEGATENLEVKKNEDNEMYITYAGNDYVKNNAIYSVDTSNNFKENLDSSSSIKIENYHMLIKETQFPGSYVNYEEYMISGTKGDFSFYFENIEDDIFDLSIKGEDEDLLYSYKVIDFNNMPYLYAFGYNMVAIDPIFVNNKYSYRFKAMKDTGIVYDSNNMFPITVDDVVLTSDDNIYIKFDKQSNSFIMLVSKNKNFCVEKSDAERVAYYVFSIDYNFGTGVFAKPKFIKLGYEKDGCGYVDKLMEG